MSNKYLIIPASGCGKRFGGNIPKQYQVMKNNKTILDNTIAKFINYDFKKIIIVVNKSDSFFASSEFYNNKKIILINGGKQRFNSVKNATNYLQTIAHGDDLIAVHDAVRPLISIKEVDKLFNIIGKNDIGAFLVKKSNNSIKKITANIIKNCERDEIFQALTPQIYRLDILVKAFNNIIENNLMVTDEAGAIESLGLNSKYLISDKINLKITNKEDLQIANLFI